MADLFHASCRASYSHMNRAVIRVAQVVKNCTLPIIIIVGQHKSHIRTWLGRHLTCEATFIIRLQIIQIPVFHSANEATEQPPGSYGRDNDCGAAQWQVHCVCIWYLVSTVAAAADKTTIAIYSSHLIVIICTH